MIQLVINGNARELGGPITISDFLSLQDIDIKHVAVGYNGKVLDKSRYNDVILQNGDVLEIVRPVGGG